MVDRGILLSLSFNCLKITNVNIMSKMTNRVYGMMDAMIFELFTPFLRATNCTVAARNKKMLFGISSKLSMQVYD